MARVARSGTFGSGSSPSAEAVTPALGHVKGSLVLGSSMTHVSLGSHSTEHSGQSSVMGSVSQPTGRPPGLLTSVA